MRPRRRDWEILGLEPGADLAAVKRAYRHRRALYDGESLATYTLLEDDERRKIQAEIDAAFRRIVGEEPPSERLGMPAEAYDETDGIDVSAATPPDPSQQPGLYLRHHRQHLGLDLQQIAAETRISPAILSKIEHGEQEGLPAPVFVRGFVLQYARALGLSDAEKLANAFLERMDG